MVVLKHSLQHSRPTAFIRVPMQDITKLCADHLRSFINDNHNIKLKASHAHELVAAVFGYQSRAAMLADRNYPLSNLRQAEFIVLTPTSFIDQRRNRLQGISQNLPDNYTIGESIFSVLLSEKLILRKVWSDLYELATFLADEYLREQHMQRIYRAPIREGVNVETRHDEISLNVYRFYQIPRTDGWSMHEENIYTTIHLERIAGHIGYAKPKIVVQREPL